jgi:hypothetical protein
VILRVIRGRTGERQLAALRDAFESKLRDSNGVGGPIRFHLGLRPDGSPGDSAVLITAFWASAEAAVQGDALEVSALSLARKHLRELDVAHFEVDESILRNSGEQPVAIRLATGRFSKHGSDLEMQDLLRQRAPDIGDDMTEAYVGRRLVGRAVEVTFVSAWRRVPTDRPLETAFWPDIALRYDDFRVEVYVAVG